MISKVQKRGILKKKFTGKGGPSVIFPNFDNKGQKDSWMAKNSGGISKTANGNTAMDALKKGNPLLAAGRVLKGVDDSLVDPTIARFKGLMNKVSRKNK